MRYLIILSLLALVVVGPIIYTIASYQNENVYTATVTDKETKKDGDNSRYLIFAESEKGKTKVFENSDLLFKFKFNSSDVYGELKQGSKYKFKTIGYRIPFFSAYEKIVSVKKVK